MSRCYSCNSCLRSSIAYTDNRLYVICKLCKKVWKVIGRDLEELPDNDLKKDILKFVNLEIID